MIFTDIEILWILICLAIGSVVAATLGFGDALIIIPLLSLIMDPRSAVIFIGYWGLFMNIVNLYKYRKFTEKKYILPVVSGGAFGSILGAMLIVVIMLRYLEIGLGLVILTFVGLKFFKQYSSNPDINNNGNSKSNAANKNERVKIDEGCGDLGNCPVSTSVDMANKSNNLESNILPPKILVPGGFLYAFLGSLLGASGPINVMMLQSSGFKKERFIANFAACGLFLTIIKIAMYTALGLFPIDNIWLLVAGYPVVYLSAKIGHSISKRWSSEKFEIIVLLVLMIMSINFIF